MRTGNRLPTEEFQTSTVSIRVVKGRIPKKEMLCNAFINFLSLLAGVFCFYIFLGPKAIGGKGQNQFAPNQPPRLLVDEELLKEALVKEALYKQALIGETNYKAPWLDYYKVEVRRVVNELQVKVKNEKEIRESCNQNIPKYEDEPVYDAKLAELLKKFYRDKNAQSLADIGCGKCEYVEQLRKDSLNAVGYVPNNDGRPVHIKKMNFIERINPTEKFEIVTNLNVGEHIFLEYEGTFLDNVAIHSSKWLIVSWSRIGTDGIMHVNNRDNPYVIQRFVDRGFQHSKEDTQFFRKELRNRFANTLLVFKRR